jgi:hypothetical protein
MSSVTDGAVAKHSFHFLFCYLSGTKPNVIQISPFAFPSFSYQQRPAYHSGHLEAVAEEYAVHLLRVWAIEIDCSVNFCIYLAQFNGVLFLIVYHASCELFPGPQLLPSSLTELTGTEQYV